MTAQEQYAYSPMSTAEPASTPDRSLCSEEMGQRDVREQPTVYGAIRTDVVTGLLAQQYVYQSLDGEVVDVRLESPELCSLASDNEDEPVLNEELAKLVMPNKHHSSVASKCTSYCNLGDFFPDASSNDYYLTAPAPNTLLRPWCHAI